jgi:hypothetical protein
MASGKKSSIDLTPHVILTNDGVGFFMDKGHKLSRISMADGSEQYGIKMAKVSPNSFQHMLRIGYLSQLEIARPEFTTVRSDLMDFSKLIVFGFLYKQFDQVLFDMLVGSSMIKDWNRANPGNIIDEKTKINDKFLNDVLAQNAEQLKSIRKAITAPLLERIATDTSLQADEKNIMIFLADRFLEYTRPFIWFILTRFSSDIEHKELIQRTRKQLDLYIRRSKIADYLTLLLMELAISAETLNMMSFAERAYGEGTDTRVMLFDPAKREALMNAMEETQTNLTIAWKIGSTNGSSIGTENKLELIIYNREAEYLELKEKVEEKMKSGSIVSLGQFYKSSSAGNAEMGLLYLGYLQDECDKVGMRLTSRVGEARGGIPSITLTVHF